MPGTKARSISSKRSLPSEALRARVDAIKRGLWHEVNGRQQPHNVQAGVQSSISVLSLVYGPTSEQLTSFQGWAKLHHQGVADQAYSHALRVASGIGPLLDAAIADFESGLTTSVRVQAKGEVLGDFLALARESLDTGSEGGDRVAAVLAAAALEETLKQLGIINDVDVYDRDLRGVIQKLKEAEILAGAPYPAPPAVL